MRIDNPTDEIACWREATTISTHLRLAAGVCVLTSGLLIGSAGGAIAAADTDSPASTTQSQDAEESTQSVSSAAVPTTTVAETAGEPTRPTLRDLIRKLQSLGKPRSHPVVFEATPDPVGTDAKDGKEPGGTPAVTHPATSDANVVAADSNPPAPGTNVAASNANAAASPTDVLVPVLKAVQPVTIALAKVAGTALTVPVVIMSLPTSETPVADVITSVQNMLISVNDVVAPLVQMQSDLYSLLVVPGLGTPPVTSVSSSGGAGLSAGAGAGRAPAVATLPPPILPVTPISDMPLLGDVTAPATLGGIATVGLSADLSLSGTAPLAVEGAAPTSAMSLLEHTVKAVLAPASLSALAAIALPGIGGLLIVCAAGMRVGYRQAKASLLLRSTEIALFARQGPIGVVGSGSLVALHPRRAAGRYPPTLRVIRPDVSRPAHLLEQVA